MSANPAWCVGQTMGRGEVRNMADTQDRQPPEGTKFKPVDVKHATRKEDMDRIRGMQDIQRHGKGPTDHVSNPSG